MKRMREEEKRRTLNKVQNVKEKNGERRNKQTKPYGGWKISGKKILINKTETKYLSRIGMDKKEVCVTYEFKKN